LEEEIKKLEKPKSWLSRLRIWFCDRMRLVPIEDFDMFYDDSQYFFNWMIGKFSDLENRFADVDRWAVAQTDFNKRVSELLDLQKKCADENLDRGVIQ